MGHTSDVLCGAGIVSRTRETDARVAARIAAGRYSTGVATGVAVGVATPITALVAKSLSPITALVATPITAGVTRLVTRGSMGGLCVAASKDAAVMLGIDATRRAGRGEQTSSRNSSRMGNPAAAADRVGRRLPTRSARGASRVMGAPSRWLWRALRRPARGWS